MQQISQLSFRFYLIAILGLMCFAKQAVARDLISIDAQAVKVCPAQFEQNVPPTFSEPECKTIRFYELNPQNNHLWVKAILTINQPYLDLQQASAFYLFGKTSSEVYFYGVKIGQNGTPHSNPEREFVGKMDVRFYVPNELLKLGPNEVIFHLSSHHGWLDLSSPMHFAGIGEYGSSQDFFQNNMLVSLLLLGALLIGAVYLAALSIKAQSPHHERWLFLMVFFAIAQLFLELSRGLFQYDYPFQDLRLILIVISAFGFGVCLLWVCLSKFAILYRQIWLLLGTVTSVMTIYFIPWFDVKTAAAILVPAIMVTVLLGWQVYLQRTQTLLTYVVILLLFDLVALITVATFHSILFYYIITALMMVLLIKQAQELIAHKATLADEQKQIAKLEFRLAQSVQHQAPPKLTLNSAGQTEILNTADIIFCKAAGDYVDIMLTDNKQRLFSGSLKSLQLQLPDTFMKVHRSYLVNLDCVNALKSAAKTSDSSSAGFLIVDNNHAIPVSRRLLPQVREVIKA
ncbi:LytTR family DNA-binding domain-containing protein [Pseudoalteromonas tunicata]|uniref:LytR/AlgR family response regulator transcription factor n=1 Tax=Pseudoalteromonas tunicata TaxID=314281 RepID=UPI00273D2C6D|nr:LytTR family DNA-binding domain-containing protein [Pseudoalteromonas tunicata]MDP5215107.1 LytTR family DNA-binding domain-containing protein [Pseudoalteromonas tunicata]